MTTVIASVAEEIELFNEGTDRDQSPRVFSGPKMLGNIAEE